MYKFYCKSCESTIEKGHSISSCPICKSEDLKPIYSAIEYRSMHDGIHRLFVIEEKFVDFQISEFDETRKIKELFLSLEKSEDSDFSEMVTYDLMHQYQNVYFPEMIEVNYRDKNSNDMYDFDDYAIEVINYDHIYDIY